MPYLATGDYYYMEEACFWGGYCLLATWPEPRQKGRGIIADQMRGDAWAWRNMADAGWIAPDGHPRQHTSTRKIPHERRPPHRRHVRPARVQQDRGLG